MKRTTIFVDAETERDLRLYAEREGRSTASVVREALAQWLDTRRAAPAVRPGFVASGRSGRRDIASRHESLVFQGLEPHGSAPARTSRTSTPRSPRSTARVPSTRSRRSR
jgi:predicted transcriptional regulator